ncbi:MAG: hypothetical protein HUU15_08865 [Candidatus Brocadiae bacterium]|nr:hypothetical protein [Candidatus Brocadiia bacterium]
MRFGVFTVALFALALETAAADPPVLERHVISLALDPASNALEATDTLELSGEGTREFDLALAPAFEVTSVLAGRLSAAWTFRDGVLHVRLPADSARNFTVTVAWKGKLLDPPKRNEMRFVTGEKSRGTIQPEGAWLPAGAQWYPDRPGSMSRFTVTARVPEDWEFIGQGGRHDYDPKTRRATWCDPIPSDGLTCVAGPYVAEQLRAGRVTVRSYFYREDAAAAADYRRAAAEWIEHFSGLLTPYPYHDFSIVENFFSTGYGMPSYTLLGADVVRMGARYLGEGGLGHEVLHCWWGNGVFVEGGNWCEALTTYCSNYLWVEKTQGPEAARKYRRHASVRFSLHVPPDADYPVRTFEGKVTEADNEIGYGKGSMLFHLVRRRIGDTAFWAGLRRVLRERTGARAGWDDFRQAFEAESGHDLEGLFTAWLDRPGAPELSLERTEQGARLLVRGPLDALNVPVRSWRAEGPVEHVVEVRNGTAEWAEPEGTTRVEVDPGYHVFRRIPAAALPICLNRVVSDGTRAVVLPEGDEAPWNDLLARLDGWERIPAAEASPARLAGRSLLVLGGPDQNPVARRWAGSGALKRGDVDVRADGWTAAGETVSLGADRALLVTVPSPDDAARQATVFFPASPGAVKASRLMLYYGWESWYVWRDGRVAARGEFPVEEPLVLELE